jgi:D-alanine-D-alanine ligase
VAEVEIDHTLIERVRELDPAYVFIVAHGHSGEDGSLQALLELLGVPYTGSDSLASALCLDKILTKRLLLRAGLPTPPFHAFSRRTFQDLGAAAVFDDVMERLGAPVVVKPARLGSSFGIKYVAEPAQLRTAVLGAVAYDDEILVERHLAGRELAVTVLGGDESPRRASGPPSRRRRSRPAGRSARATSPASTSSSTSTEILRSSRSTRSPASPRPGPPRSPPRRPG